MATDTNRRGGRRDLWRIAMWSAAAALLLLPLLAMQFTDEVAWNGADFALFGAMLLAACGTCEVVARMTGNHSYRAATGMAVASAFLLVWMNLAVGLIGREDNPANLVYGGVIAIGIVGAAIARLRSAGMAYAMVATASAQALVGFIAALLGWGSTLVLTVVFVGLWLASAALYRRAAQEQRQPGGSP